VERDVFLNAPILDGMHFISGRCYCQTPSERPDSIHSVVQSLQADLL